MNTVLQPSSVSPQVKKTKIYARLEFDPLLNSKFERAVYMVGDIHAEYDLLKKKIKANDINFCYLICVGDLGVGYELEEKQLRIFKDLDKFFEKRDIIFMSIRGNHDDPSYFDGNYMDKFDNFKLIRDYHTCEINGQVYLFVGGAVSVDRLLNTKDINKATMCYWPDEKFVFSPEKITNSKTDVLITHTAPNWIGPLGKNGIRYYLSEDPTLWEECKAERIELNKLIEYCKPAFHFCGHFHNSFVKNEGGCFSTILDILEIKEFFKY